MWHIIECTTFCTMVGSMCEIQWQAACVKSNLKVSNLLAVMTFQKRYVIFMTFCCTYIFSFFLRRYNFREVLAFSTSFFHLVRFLIQSFQFVIFILVISLFTSSSHLFLGLPRHLVSAGDHSYTFFYHAVFWHTMYVSEPTHHVCACDYYYYTQICTQCKMTASSFLCKPLYS